MLLIGHSINDMNIWGFVSLGAVPLIMPISRVTYCEAYCCSHITTDQVTLTTRCSGNILYHNIYLIIAYYSSVHVDLIVVNTSTSCVTMSYDMVL